MVKYLEVGKIVNTHGVKGEVKIIPLTDDPNRFKKLKWVYLDRTADKDTGPDNGDEASFSKLNITSVKFFKSSVIIKFNEINTMEEAEALKGTFLKIDRKNAVKLPPDAYFICDLLECAVYNEIGKKLGVLVNVLQTGSNDVYVVRDENNREILVPALKSTVKEISINDKKITVSLPEGLVDDEI